MRFEPGQTRTVKLVAYAGERQVYGFSGAVKGPLDAAVSDATDGSEHAAYDRRAAYAEMFGPTDRRPRAPGRHRAVHRGRAGPHDLRRGGQVRRRQGDPRRHGPVASDPRAEGAVDTVITNALILDHWGIVKADIGIRDGRIAGIGKAGNPDTQPGVDIVIGAGTEIIAGEGKIVTAGGIDCHIHFICPQQIDEALVQRRHDA